MVDAERMHQAQTDAARVLLGLARDGGYETIELFWSELAGNITAATKAVDAGGTTSQLKMPSALIGPMSELREVMAEPDKGAWLSAIVRVAAAGQYEFEFNYDRRPYWYSPTYFDPTPNDLVDPSPSDEAFLEDLEDHPRSAEFLPAWYPGGSSELPATMVSARPNDGASDAGGAALFPASLSALVASPEWVEIAEAVRQQLTQMQASAGSGARSDGLVQAAYERVFDTFIAPHDAARVKRLWEPAAAAAGYPPKSTDVADDESVEDPSPTLEILLEDVSDVITTIAEHQLAAAG